MQKSILGLAIVLLCSGSAFSQQTQRPTALREIIPGHYAFSSGSFNSGLIVTSEGVVVLDALNSESVGKAEREAIANTVRHADASKVHIALSYGQDLRVRVVIEDDGRGLSALQSDDKHYGLSIMRERANSLGGELALEPREGGGTRVSVSFAPDRMTPEPAARGDS